MWYSVAKQSLDRPKVVGVIFRHKAGGRSDIVHPACPTNPMDIVFGRVWKVEVHHVADVLHIEPTSRDIRRYQDVISSSSKSL